MTYPKKTLFDGININIYGNFIQFTTILESYDPKLEYELIPLFLPLLSLSFTFTFMFASFSISLILFNFNAESNHALNIIDFGFDLT